MYLKHFVLVGHPSLGHAQRAFVRIAPYISRGANIEKVLY